MRTRTINACAASRSSFALIVVLAAACGDEPEPPAVSALVPADWASSSTEVRNCRRSSDHDLNYVRVFADDAALAPYMSRTAPFPDRSVLIKAEYADDACSDLAGFTAMRKEAGFAAGGGDWHWQRLDKDRMVIEDGKPARCTGCHAACGVPPEGYDFTCTVP